MRGDTKATMVASIVGILAVMAVLIVLCLRISANDHAKILRDQRVKVACVEQGKQLVGGNCIQLGR